MRPARVKVLGAMYDIVEKKMKGAYGMHFFGKCRIQIAPGLAHDREREVLVHELVHAVDEAMQSQLSEDQVEKLGVGVYALLSDNPELVRYLVEGEQREGHD
jgi:hypothetical protein